MPSENGELVPFNIHVQGRQKQPEILSDLPEIRSYRWLHTLRELTILLNV